MSRFFSKLRGNTATESTEGGSSSSKEVEASAAAATGESHDGAPVEEEVVLNESKRTIISHLLKQIKFGEPIKHLSLPCFVLQPRSMLESFTDTFNCLDELYRIQEIQDDEKRFIQFLKFSLTAWHTRPKGIKKPFNPVIGELYDCYWDPSIDEKEKMQGTTETGDDVSHFVSEQISHHPSCSAFCFYNKNRGVVVNGNVNPTYVKFYGNFAESSLRGLIVYHFLKINQVYEMTLPVIGVRGVVLGKLAPFVNGKAVIRSADGKYQAHLEYLTNGLLSSSKNHNGIKGHVTVNGKTLYKIKGHWDSQIFITPDSSSISSANLPNDHILMDCKKLKKYSHFNYPIERQPKNSSENIWRVVIDSINNNDDKTTAEEKARIEQKQRVEEAQRKEKGVSWVPERFVLKPYNSEYPETYIYKDLESIFPNYYSSKPTS
ncbi:oxysterol binding family protein [Cavenderia fasciculata]|uniref:Oxysterol binding family protein n=1 Tax=Cavenderia fasciculata TaxID=261658 RepID=F4Q0J7_CACFS|nr:oxysterol binding family protein [Cavenderia fasciculata]EGG18348.1 oxysterol binding family protein [Cavenderia fasciculata]|eukprot:XP_004366252.1 oxysterol binding family protein [Cavenderia fasciculata]